MVNNVAPNLFATVDGRLKVLDFGIARERNAASRRLRRLDPADGMKGAAWLPPEAGQVCNREIDTGAVTP
jgi:hypothetical protein